MDQNVCIDESSILVKLDFLYLASFIEQRFLALVISI